MPQAASSGWGRGRQGDGQCHKACNIEACGFDSLDGNSDCNGPGDAPNEGFVTSNCHTAWIRDGVCDIGCYQYNGDGGDCDGAPGNGICVGTPRATGRRHLAEDEGHVSASSHDTSRQVSATCPHTPVPPSLLGR